MTRLKMISKSLLTFTAVVASAALIMPASAQRELASNWVRIGADADGSILYIDADYSETGQDEGGPFVVAHFISDDSGNVSKRQDSTFTRYQVRCGPQTSKLVHLATFDENGETLQSGDVTGRLAQIPYAAAADGSVGATIIRRACEVANQ